AAAGSASAQDYRAKVPMGFSIGTADMTPGPYQILVKTGGGSPLVVFRNLATHNSAILVASVRSDAPKAWRREGKPLIVFTCVQGKCAVAKLWDGLATSAYQFPAPKLRGAEAERASITIALTKAD
ncbi:MAG TPA: hypothetical protein VGS58_14170, partial [Candidatus Sulfopaludibacter sp.]|nr:hypothetical protein [Candidatus Sulfopaludibacter sp.]